jgi:phosphohistidine phosphatase
LIRIENNGIAYYINDAILQRNIFRVKVYAALGALVESRRGFEERGVGAMDFYLARHGEAVADAIDPRRPLTHAGRENVERVARLAVQKAVNLSVIFHSGILRAAQTAEIFAAHLAPGGAVLAMSGLRPEDDPSLAAAELAVSGSPVMLVGHLPHMNRLASLLALGDAEGDGINFMPAMMACYSRAGSLWALKWTLTPCVQ